MSPIFSEPRALFVLLSALLAATVILAALVARNELRLKRIYRGSRRRDIDETLLSLDRELKELRRFREKTEHELHDHETRLRRSIRNVETIRFNPFEGTSGGNQSFASAFVNDDGDGVVVSGIYSRDRIGMFAKPVKKKISEYELSQEEKKVLMEALG